MYWDVRDVKRRGEEWNVASGENEIQDQSFASKCWNEEFKLTVRVAEIMSTTQLSLIQPRLFIFSPKYSETRRSASCLQTQVILEGWRDIEGDVTDLLQEF